MPVKSQKRVTEIQLEDLVSRAPRSPSADIYSNYARISATLNEIIFDFYALMPDIGHPTGPKATHLQRVIIPIHASKGFVGALNDLIEKYQTDTGITLLDQRKDMPGPITTETGHE